MGHDFGEVLTERDRHERGDEVVVTVREYRECDRCGETRVVSENKEVRRSDVASARTDDESPEPEPVPDVAAGGTDYEDVSAEEDDGVILEDEPEERAPGAWPESDDEEGADEDEAGEPAPWPAVEGEDEGFDAEPSDGAPVEGVEFSSGLTPEASANDAGGEGGDVLESTAGGGGRGANRPRPSGRQQAITAETELVCPECEHTARAENSSLRPGDICPECRLGYLAERER